MPPAVIDLLLFLHLAARLPIATAHGPTRVIHMLRVVQQGNPESPLLHALLSGHLVRAQGNQLRPPGEAERGLIQAYIDDLLVVAHTLEQFVEGMEAVAAYLGTMGLTPESAPWPAQRESGVCTWVSAPTWKTTGTRCRRRTPTPIWDSSCSQTGSSPCSASTGCAWRRCNTGVSTPSRRPKDAGPHPRDSGGGVIQYVAPFIADDPDTARHQDHIAVQVAKDKARYAFDASRGSLQDDRTLGLARVPTQCQQAVLVNHRWASVRAGATRMFWEIGGAHGICPEVHYLVPEFAALAGGDWVNCIPRALVTFGVGLYNPIECPRAAHVQLQSLPGNVVTLRTARLRHRDTCRLKVPHTTHMARAPRAAPPLPGQRRPVAGDSAGVPQPVRQ